VPFSNITSTTATATFSNNYNGAHYLGNVATTSGLGYEVVKGLQPSGSFVLTYTCESNTVPVTVAVSYGTVTVTGATLELYKWLRLKTTYHQIVALQYDSSTGLIVSGTISPSYSTAETIAGGSALTQAEYGVFYSDPGSADGLSYFCREQSNRFTTSAIAYVASAATVKSTLTALTAVISQSTSALTVTRSYYAKTQDYVGYKWTVTFNKVR
jgi:hypothetical protein